jgi:hypothetical protein
VPRRSSPFGRQVHTVRVVYAYRPAALRCPSGGRAGAPGLKTRPGVPFSRVSMACAFRGGTVRCAPTVPAAEVGTVPRQRRGGAHDRGQRSFQVGGVQAPPAKDAENSSTSPRRCCGSRTIFQLARPHHHLLPRLAPTNRTHPHIHAWLTSWCRRGACQPIRSPGAASRSTRQPADRSSGPGPDAPPSTSSDALEAVAPDVPAQRGAVPRSGLDLVRPTALVVAGAGLVRGFAERGQHPQDSC